MTILPTSCIGLARFSVSTSSGSIPSAPPMMVMSFKPPGMAAK